MNLIVHAKRKPLMDYSFRGLKIKAAPSYSPTVKTAVPLPQAGLTSEFGMGSGISPPPSAQPKRKLLFLVKNISEKVY